MAFLNIRFPTEISGFAKGGGEWLTNVVTMEDGSEQRLTVWDQEKSYFTISGALRTRTSGKLCFDELNSLHKQARGRSHTFRFRDQKDYKASKSSGVLGTGFGDGKPTYQICKKYLSTGGLVYFREILKPVASTFKVYVNAIERFDLTVDFNTGVVTVPEIFGGYIDSIALGLNPLVTMSAPHTFSSGDKIYLTGLPSNSNLYNKVVTITETTSTTFRIASLTNNVASIAYSAALKYFQPTDILTCEFEFDLCVRFDNDRLDAVINDGVIEIDTITLVETKDIVDA